MDPLFPSVGTDIDFAGKGILERMSIFSECKWIHVLLSHYR